MGGLRASNTEVLDLKGKEYIREHWEHVRDASGQVFDFTFFDQEGFIYDTEPACRAVVTMRRLASEYTMGYLARVHRAFYAEKLDVTRGEVLAKLATELGIPGGTFLTEFESEDAKAETQGDFAVTHQARIPGFPTLLAGTGEGALTAITTGYQPWEAIESGIDNWLKTEDTSES